MASTKMLKRVYLAAFFFSAGSALAAYINSSFLNTFFSEKTLGIIYALGAMFALFFLSEMAPTLRYFGNRKLILTVVTVAIAALFGMTFLQTPFLVAAAFIAYMVCGNIMIVCFDVFVEHYSPIRTVGHIRGLFLTVTNTAWVLAPLITTTVLVALGFKGVYALVVGMLAIVFLMVYNRLYLFSDNDYKKVSVGKALKFIGDYRPLLSVTVVSFLLQFFYAWMVIYSPIYLHNHIGLSWKEVGLVFTSMLVVFPIIQYPLGKFADRKSTEKEFMTLGLIVAGFACIAISQIDSTRLWPWIIVFVISRIGASTIEAMSEIHFFKETRDADASILGVFRNMVPLAYLIAPILGSILLIFVPINYLFLVLGLMMLCGIWFSLHLEKINKLWKKSHTQSGSTGI